MLKIGLIGIGFMGRTHLETYARLEQEGVDLRLTAICDIDPKKLQGGAAGGGNIETSAAEVDFSRYHTYTDIAEMLDREELDAVDIALPTYLHHDVTVQCLKRGLHVLCEKPMAMNAADCADMIREAEAAGKRLMIGQCLRFWPAYVYLKRAIEKGTYGKVRGGYFFRGGATPTWAEWLLQKNLSGGAMLDMHVHDTDAVNWLFGKPKSVSSLSLNAIPGSGYDIVSTHYAYEDGKVINTQVDWTLQGDYGFQMEFRVNFERGNMVFRDNVLKVNPNDAPGFAPALSPDMGYYFELKYFAEALLHDRPVTEAPPEDTMDTVAIIEAEIASAEQQGAWVQVE